MGPGFQIKVRDKRDKYLLMCPVGRSATNITGSLARDADTRLFCEACSRRCEPRADFLDGNRAHVAVAWCRIQEIRVTHWFFARYGAAALCEGTGGGPLRPVSGGLVFSKLSKLLNQENALSAPCCLRGDFRSPQAPGAGAGMLRTGLIRHCYCLLHPSHHADKR